MNIRGKRPVMLVLSAPSGGGKTTLCRMLRNEFTDMFYSISCTTRPPRPGEQDGRDYYFLSPTAFRKQLKGGVLLESATVHGHAYGTPEAPLAEALAAGRDVVMDIDVQGAARIRDHLSARPQSPVARAFVDVFIVPPDKDTLRRRLEQRGQDSRTVMERRLRNALEEMRQADRYRYVVVNDRLETAYDRLRAILLAEHCRVWPAVDVVDREGDAGNVKAVP